jgi:hypothetical protein
MSEEYFQAYGHIPQNVFVRKLKDYSVIRMQTGTKSLRRKK